MNQRSSYFFFAGCCALIAALVIADYGDGSSDRLHLVLASVGAIGFLVSGIRADKSKAR